MSIELLRATLGWLAIFNLSLLTVWFVAFVAIHDGMYNLHRLWFQISIESFDAIHYAGMAWYKLSTWMLFILPYLALRMLT